MLFISALIPNVIINYLFRVNRNPSVSLSPVLSSLSPFFSLYSDFPNTLSTQLILTLCSWILNIPKVRIREKEQRLNIFFQRTKETGSLTGQRREQVK